MLNNQSFNMMKALQEAEEVEIKKKITVDSYHEELIESVDLTENCDKVEESTEETQEVSKEERLASLKTQLEVDGAQLADDEKQAIQEEINQLEAELNECDTKPMTEESCETKVEENVEINVDSETGDVEVTTDEGENVEVVDETEEPDESTDEEIIDEPSEEAPVDTEVVDEAFDEIRANHYMKKAAKAAANKDSTKAVNNMTKAYKITDKAISKAGKKADKLTQKANDLKYKVNNMATNVAKTYGKELDEKLKEESETPITEQEVTNLREVKNQGNIFMLQDDSKFIVGENYNESEALIENAEIYESKEEADKDYLDRCEITKDGEPAEIEDKVEE